jgi:flagellar motor switch protein FliM
MNALSQEPTGMDVPSSPGKTAGRLRSVQPCDFRAAGQLSNENLRALMAIHEACARNLPGALADYVGAELKVKLLTLDQVSVREYVAGVPELSYLASFPLSAESSMLTLEFDTDLIFPVIDLLLGGTGVAANEPRELSEIEGEIMQDLALLIARQVTSAWGMTDVRLAAAPRVDRASLPNVFRANAKVTLARFAMEVAGTVGVFRVVFPSSLVSVLIKQSKAGQPEQKGSLRFFPMTSLRERILDSDVTVAADLPNMRVSVRDLIGLQPGYVLKLRAPVRSPGMLTVEGTEIFEAVPVRNGAQKAAQVGRRVPSPSWGKG